MTTPDHPFTTVSWVPAHPPRRLPGKLRLLDQTQLPARLVYIETDDLDRIHDAIRRLVVRGAPAIGDAAALGAAAAAQHLRARTKTGFLEGFARITDRLASSRPTAVNLFWALDRMRSAAERLDADHPQGWIEALLDEALLIVEEDRETCSRIGRNGVALLRDGMGVLTHCNAGALATAGDGTALAPVYQAHRTGLHLRVFADETRPLLQGARLTAWELGQRGVPVTLLCDNMAGALMASGRVDIVIVGADRIAANGDTANKIGTYGVALLAGEHGIPFYVAAPLSTVDRSLPSGDGIPIETRAPDEVTRPCGIVAAPDGIDVFSPAFDVTPARYIGGIITETGILRPPYETSIREAFRA